MRINMIHKDEFKWTKRGSKFKTLKNIKGSFLSIFFSIFVFSAISLISFYLMILDLTNEIAEN